MHLGKRLGIEAHCIKAAMLPEIKAEFVQDLLLTERNPMAPSNPLCHPSRNRRVVMMIGDGVNDAVSLSKATIGVSVGLRSELAMATADVVISSDLKSVIAFIDLAKFASQTVHINLLWAFGFNAITIPIAAGCFYPLLFLPPALSGSFMALSSISVVLNSLRLLRFKTSLPAQISSY